jgi:hypothetical protein
LNRDKQDTAGAYLARVTQRLKDDGFTIEENITYKGQTFDYVSKRTKFEIDKYSFVATSYLFARFSSPDISSLRDFSAKSFKYTLREGGIIPIAGGIRWPRGLYLGFMCYPVAVADDIDEETSDAIRVKAPPKHFMAFEMPVVYSLASGTLYYCEITPMWGGLYYDQMRLNINIILAP